MIEDMQVGIRKNRLQINWFCVLSLLIILSMLGGCGTMQTKQAETTVAVKFPEKPITVIVPFTAGGALDMVARAMEKKAMQYLGQSMVVVNKPGGTGAIGWNELAGANPDGYTMGITSPEIILNSLYGPTKYNYVTALAPVAQVTEGAMILAVRADQPWQDLTALVQYAKGHPGELKFGHGGVGSLAHIMGETFAKAASISIEQVPFRGASEATAALLGGHIQMLTTNPMAISEFVKAGKIRVLAIADKQRSSDSLLAQVSTFREVGYDVVFNNRFGIAIPKEVPPDIKTKIVEGVHGIVNDPEFKQDIEKLGLPVTYLNPHDTEVVWISEQRKYTEIVQETGILEKIKEQKK